MADAKPHHASSRGYPEPEQPRRTAEKLPPPVFVVLFLLFALYLVATGFTNNQDPVKVVINTLKPTTSTSTVIVQAPPIHTTANVPPVLRELDSGEMSSTEQTFIAIKPDGVQRGLVGPIISRFENRGFKLVAIKLVTPGKEHLETHYADLKDKPFFPGLVKYMNSGPICAMVWEGRDAVKTGRAILGATNPLASAPGTIRGDYAIDVGRNVCHGSDSVESAKKEIALWFKENELVSWKSAQFDWIYEKP